MIKKGKRPPPRKEEPKARINARIRVPQVRLIDAEGKQVGIVDTAVALKMAEEAEFDLVEVAPEAKPPVCRIMDYGKFVYEKKKKTKRTHTSTLKEIKMRPKISVHDFDFKSRHIEKFLKHGDKVRVTLMFRGREMEHVDLSIELLHRVAREHEAYSQLERPPLREGRQMFIILAPQSGKKKEGERPAHAKNENP